MADNFLTCIKQNRENLKNFGIALGTQILLYLPVLKKQRFNFEREYRLVMLLERDEKPFMEYKFEPDALTEILIGPCATQEFEDDVRKVSSGYTVTKSKIILPCN